MPKSVCVMGLGYIGLPTAALIASRGVFVHGVDINPDVVEKVSQGKVHIVEPDLDGLVQKVVADGTLTAHTVSKPADVFLIAVPTPIKENHAPDVSLVDAAVKSIAPHLKKGDLVILESTLPVGSTEGAAQVLARARPDLKFPTRDKADRGQNGAGPDIHLAYCPERVLPGKILSELIHNDRSIGGLTPACARAASTFYQIFLQGGCFATNARTAELVKLTENAFRDVNIAFANELSMICNALHIDPWEMIGLANRHPRVNILQPGPGVGGHCIAIDPWFIVASTPKLARLIRTAREVNESKPIHVVERVNAAIEERTALSTPPRIACLGLAFKPDVDDLRNSPAMRIVAQLATLHKNRVIAVEPHISELPDNLKRLGVTLSDALTAIDQADIIVLLVDHRQFKLIDPRQLGQKTIVDTRGVWAAHLKEQAHLPEYNPAANADFTVAGAMPPSTTLPQSANQN